MRCQHNGEGEGVTPRNGKNRTQSPGTRPRGRLKTGAGPQQRSTRHREGWQKLKFPATLEVGRNILKSPGFELPMCQSFENKARIDLLFFLVHLID
jgi:hypothetical protein